MHALVLASLGGCSDAASELEGMPEEIANEGSPQAESAPSEGESYEDARGAALTPSEESALVSHMSQGGILPEDVAFFGRLVALQGDGYFHADDLLQAAGFGALTDKGKVPTQLVLTNLFPNCSVRSCGSTLPFQYAFGTVDPQRPLAFRRPDTTKTYYLVVDDDAPSFFTTGTGGGMVGQAASAIENASSSDCLGTSLFTVLRNAAYKALPLSTLLDNYKIRITFGEFSSVCAQRGVGCSNFPRLGRVDDGDVSVSRLRFGDRIGLVTVPLVQQSTAVVALNAYSVGIMTHELLHTIGVGHPQVSGAEEQTVPGTASGTSHLSIMHSTVENMNYRDTLQNDDRAVLSKLYSGSCAYSENFKLLAL